MRISYSTALVTLLLSSVTITQAQSTLPLPRWMQPDAAPTATLPNLERFASAVLPSEQFATSPQAAINPATPPLPAAAQPQPSLPAVLPTAAPFPVISPSAPAAAVTLGSNPFRKEQPVVMAGPVKVDAFSLDQVAAPSSPADTQSAIDMRALRFYAQQRNLERVTAETRRLKAENPGWEPPADLFAPTISVDEQPLWDLFAAGNYGEMRRRIAQQQQQKPDWHLSEEMNQKLTDGEGRAKITAAARYGRWTEVVERATASPSLLVCANMDLLWTVAEGLARTGKMAESFELYRYAIANCGSEKERVATVQKAAQQLPAEGKDALIQLATSITATPELYESLRFDELRGRIGDVAAGRQGRAIPAAELEGFATFIQAEHSATDAGLLGWYFYAQQQYPAASAWFQAGMQIQSDPKLVEGLVLALRGDDKSNDAQDVAYRYRETAPEIAKLYIEVVAERLTDSDETSDPLDDFADARSPRDRNRETGGVTSAEIRRFAEVVLAEKSALGAQALGWRFVKLSNLKSAEEWFTRSVDWEDNEGGVIGTAVVAARLKQSDRLKAIKAKYQAHYPELADFRTWSAGPAKIRTGKKSARTYRSAAKPAKPVNQRNEFWNRIEFK